MGAKPVSDIAGTEFELSEDEITQRRDAALLRALSTPHKRQKEMKIGATKPGSAGGASPKKRGQPPKAGKVDS